MANLDNFTNDEKIMIFNIFSTKILANKLAKLAGIDADYIKEQITEANAEYIKTLSDNDLNKLLNFHRESHREAKNEVTQARLE